MARDKVAEIRERLTKIADADTRLVWAMRKFAGHDRADLERLLKYPAELFPVGEFQTKAEARIAYYATLPRAQWPAAMQTAHERVDSLARREGKTDPHKAGINLLMVSIPAPQGQLSPSAEVVRFRRTKKGALKRIIDVEAKQLDEAEEDADEEVG